MRAINLMFHDVKIKPSRWNTTPERFVEIMEFIATHPNKDKVTITVDDAGKGNHEFMLPLLENYNLKATIFVPTRFISKVGNTSTYMTAEQIRDFSDFGHTIGSHSHSHPTNISLMSESEISYEWRKSKRILEEITEKEVVSCSIPGGFYSNEQWQILANLGYQKIFNSVPTYNVYIENEMELLGRFSIERNITMDQLNQILSYDSFNQKRLFVWQKASQFFHTLKHRIKGS
jgi:peptidoglycan/xylan/chitin deacetylase (PgdA/CDA1 family)